eukprot:75799-Prymnesium_polylepis.1
MCRVGARLANASRPPRGGGARLRLCDMIGAERVCSLRGQQVEAERIGRLLHKAAVQRDHALRLRLLPLPYLLLRCVVAKHVLLEHKPPPAPYELAVAASLVQESLLQHLGHRRTGDRRLPRPRVPP